MSWAAGGSEGGSMIEKTWRLGDMILGSYFVGYREDFLNLPTKRACRAGFVAVPHTSPLHGLPPTIVGPVGGFGVKFVGEVPEFLVPDIPADRWWFCFVAGGPGFGLIDRPEVPGIAVILHTLFGIMPGDPPATLLTVEACVEKLARDLRTIEDRSHLVAFSAVERARAHLRG